MIELMIVIVIVGILAALSTYGVRRYMESSKSAEALQNVGAIARAIRAVATRDNMSGTLLAAGQEAVEMGASNNGSGDSTSGKGDNGKGNSGKGNSGTGNNGNGATVNHNPPGMCASATPVPSSMNAVKGRKYQPNPADGKDYNAGDKFTGWKCLQFSIDSPHLYQYRYEVGGPPVEVTLPHGGTPKGLQRERTWSASAQGDVDGDGRTSWFILQGYLTDTREVVTSPAVDVVDGDE